MKYSFLIVSIFLTLFSLSAQDVLKGTVRGTIKDNIDHSTLAGVMVYLIGYEDKAVFSDAEGRFEIKELPTGRYQLQTNYMGYENYIQTIEITSGKELVIELALSEKVFGLNEVVVTAQNEKLRPVNSMSYASTRTFSVTESNKFAAAVDDPARMAVSYAGVVSTDDGNNAIAIRGNAPSGLLWRLEGIDIPNPNHYAQPTSSGGGISVLSAQMLSNSDFSTGAFSAEYGNALSGVFDLKFRNGNNQKTEYTLKAGIIGLEAAVEGPFSKNYNGSYLINYRYSTLTLLDKIGIDLNGELNFRDFNYHVVLPTKKWGTFSLFGMHGWSSQRGNETLDTTEMDALYHHHRFEFISNMSIDGIKHYITPWKNGFLKTTLAMTTSKSAIHEDQKTIYNTSTFFDKYRYGIQQEKISFHTSYTHKLSSLMSVRSGLIYDRMTFDIKHDDFPNETASPVSLILSKGRASLIRSYAQLQLHFNEKWTTNLGFHYLRFQFNQTAQWEPRLHIGYKLSPKSEFSLAYGLHGQINPLPIYFIKVDDHLPNKNLDLQKAHHLVLGYQFQWNDYTRLKTEIYQQFLLDIPVGVGQEHLNYSTINQQFGFPDFSLTSKGQGNNTGLEATLERFMHNNLYYIITASLSDSRYRTTNGQWLDTRYNTQYSLITTLGKEWAKGKKKENVFGFNLKSMLIGGQRYTPIDLEASITAGKEILDESKAFSLKMADYWRLDLGFKYKRNHKRFTSTLALDIQNATSRKNVGGVEFNQEKGKVEFWYQTPLLPILSYKVEF